LNKSGFRIRGLAGEVERSQREQFVEEKSPEDLGAKGKPALGLPKTSLGPERRAVKNSVRGKEPPESVACWEGLSRRMTPIWKKTTFRGWMKTGRPRCLKE